MSTLILGGILAVVVEALVSYGESIFDYFKKGDVKKAVKQISAIVVAVFLTFQVGITLLSFFMDKAINPAVDMVISGIFISRGANYLFDLAKMIYRIGRGEELELVSEDELMDEWDDDTDEDLMIEEESEVE